jgi:hypothetical protein
MESKMKSLDDYRCHLCGKLFTNIKQHIAGKHRNVSNETKTMIKPLGNDPIEAYKAYYNTK